MLTSKWHMHRMGLIDFWFYVNEEFLFKDGHMLLRGSNGSGKSVTMQSFIPLLLDGNKSSERLDSFGTRSRKIENYLLEEDGDRDDRIGYLYLEFKREDSDIYKTIGMGLHARRNKPVDAWYFVIEDNRRINYDIQLMEHNLAITKQMMKNLLQSQYIDTQKEYMDRVNKALFNFPTRDDYKEAINLLLQLRSPKLSNSLKPTMINDILSNSLQPLSEDDLRPMSEAISNMDEIKDQLDVLKQSFAAAQKIAGIYDQYNYACLDRKVSAFMMEEQKEKDVLKKIAEQKQLKQTSEQELTHADEQKKQIQIEQDVLDEEYGNLVKQDIMQLVEDVERHKRDLAVQNQSLQSKNLQEEEKDNLRIDIRNQLEAYQNKKDSNSYDLQRIFHDMCELQETMQFEEHGALDNELMSHLDEAYDFTYTLKKISDELAALQNGLNLFTKINNENVMIENFMNEKEQLEAELEKAEKELKAYEQQFYALQEEYKEHFSIWNKENMYLKLNDEEMLKIFDQIQLFEEEETYHIIDELIHHIYFNQYQGLVKQISQLENDMKELDAAVLKTSDTIHHWKNLTDPEPDQDQYMQACRAYLNEKGIRTCPFYTLLEYDTAVPEKARDTFEEELQRMGLLNALVADVKDRDQVVQMPEGMADQFIFVNRDVASLKECEITWHDGQIDFLQLLEQIGVEGTSISVYENWYQNGIITGTLSHQIKTTFIGQKAREVYRQNMIQELEAELKELRLQKTDMNNRHDQLEVRLEELETEFHSYPGREDIASARQDMRNAEQLQQNVIVRIKGITKQIRGHEEIIHGLRLDITAIADHLGIGAVQDVFSIRKECFEEYKELVLQLSTYHLQYLNACDLWKSADVRLQDVQRDLDTIRYEHTQISDTIQKLEQLIQQKETQLNEQGYQDVKKRIEEIIQRRNEIPEMISNLDKQIGKLLTLVENCKEQMAASEEELKRQTARKEQCFKQYQEELKLGYVIRDDEADMTIANVHKRIQNTYHELKNKEALGNDLQTSFYTNRGFLQEYGLSLFALFEAEEETMRLDINTRYKGVRIPFAHLLQNLKDDIDQQSILLEDSDRSLIEDILVNTISRKIRLHIQNSKRWVDVMNRYMTSMNTSSGLKLSLLWKSHKAENDEELSSENLVKLLEKDIHILKDTDLKHLSSHFRSKIATARKLSEEQDNNESFHQVMKKVMDYREWFDFRILFEKTGEKKKELTNNAFYAFSGGEKAMSMYIPLFSAVAAKFEGAGDDAPLLIALDEAFAGVDEKNINNMFELIAKFRFDYIMNSQVLWGDYPSVSALAIHELFRPENARFVTVISYEWNGHQKRMVHR